MRLHRSAVASLLALAALAPIESTHTAAATTSVPASRSDFNGDGYADLAIGAPTDDAGGASPQESGSVTVLYGSATGVSADGDQRWTQDSPGVEGTPNRYDHFGAAVASGDFDADGFADLAIGNTNDAEAGSVGSVNVLRGSTEGLTPDRDQLWVPLDLRHGEVTNEEWFGSTLATGYLDGDGFGDLAIGARCAVVDSMDCIGAVHVVYGSPTGLQVTGNQYLTRETPGIQGTIAAGDAFGSSLAIANFGNGSQDDLAIGVPYSGGGAVHVLYGSSHGVSGRGDQLWTQDSDGIVDRAQLGDAFGFSLAAGQLGEDLRFWAKRRADLVIGVPGERVDGIASAGAVQVLYGSRTGLTSRGSQFWTQNAPGVEDESEIGDDFGISLAVGDLGRGGDREWDDVAIGVLGEDTPTTHDAGAVAILYTLGDQDGLSSFDDQLWTQDAPGIDNLAEPSDWFGTSIAIADYGRTSAGDLAIGVPGENVGDAEDAGAVNVLYGSDEKLLHAAGNQFLSQDSPGVVGDATPNAGFASVDGVQY